MISPQSKFSDEVTSDELLSLMVILYRICLDRDIVNLNRFVVVSSKIMGVEDFNKLLRTVVRMLGGSKCGDSLCSDWVMTKLYEIYTSYGANPAPDL
jgi:hypothetical protein